MSKTYGYMALSLMVSFISAFVGAHSGIINLFSTMGMQSVIVWLLILGVEFFMIYQISKVALRNPAMAKFGLFIFSALDGFTMTGLLAFYSAKLVMVAFIIATVDFASMAFIGKITKRSTSHMEKQLFAMVIALIVVTFVEFFLRSSLIFMVISGAGVVIFSLMTMCDVNRLKRLAYQYGDYDGLAVVGALNLYIDFINIFTDVLNLLGFSQSN